MRSFCSLILLFIFVSADSFAANLVMPDDPRQSISYWKSQTITRDENHLVDIAQQVFNRLLRAWDKSKIEPGLYVVQSDQGAWAASLADGNILLSEEALSISFEWGEVRGTHLLGFVLAHELSHQRSDDLWHFRFFRDMRRLQADEQSELLQDWDLDRASIIDLEQKEAQADRDGLIWMASVGFDPWQVINGEDFFTAWVENIWQQPCRNPISDSMQELCQQADQRARRTRLQLDAVAGQSMLFDLGIQSAVAGDYQSARYYFTLYGREFPGKAVLAAVAWSHLAEAMTLRQKVNQLDSDNRFDFYYPLILTSDHGFPSKGGSSRIQSATRSAIRTEIEQLDRQIRYKVNQAIPLLEKSIRLDPDDKSNFLLLSIAHLLEENTYLMRGVLQGRFIPKFGSDPLVELLLAMTTALEGDSVKAVKQMKLLIDSDRASELVNENLLRYSLAFNLVALSDSQNDADRIRTTWTDLAKRAQAKGYPYLFQLAVKQLKAEPTAVPIFLKAPSIRGLRLGDRRPRDNAAHIINELWIEGDQFQVIVYESGIRLVNRGDGTVISARQSNGHANFEHRLRIGDSADRPIKLLGIPDRRLHYRSGEYLAFDRLGLGVQIDDSKIVSWFLYKPASSGG